MLHFFLNATGHDYLLRYLLKQRHRIYPVGFKDSRHSLDKWTIDAVQTIESFLDDVPCDGTWRSKSCYEDIVTIAKKRQKSGTIVLAVATEGNYAVALNWCVSLLRLGVDNFMIVALDDESYKFFDNMRAPIARLAAQKIISEKKDIWIRRSLITYMILRSGINVLVSDFDAVSVKSPFKSRLFSFDDPSVDIITTPSNFPNPNKNELPIECPSPNEWWSSMEWVHQPCMGWTFFRSTDRMLMFYEDRLLYDVIKFRDDQIGFNCAIRRAGAVWREPRDGEKWRGMLTFMSSPKLTILVLPASRYVRNCTAYDHSKVREQGDTKNVELFHCKGYEKEESAKSNGFWFLRYDWNRVDQKQADFRDYLGEISARP